MVGSALAVAVARSLMVPLGKRLPAALLGDDFQRSLAKSLDGALRLTVAEFAGSPEAQAELLSILVETLGREVPALHPPTWSAAGGSLTVLTRAELGQRLAPLADGTVTGSGASSFELLGVDGEALADALTRHLIASVVSDGLNPTSGVRLLASVYRDEQRHSEIVARLEELQSTMAPTGPREVSNSASVSILERSVVVPDGTDEAVLRLAVTNLSLEHMRLRGLVVTVAEKSATSRVRLSLPGAPLPEYEARVDLRETSAIDKLAGLPEQFVLPPNGSEAFRIVSPFDEGVRYKLVVHAELESLVDRTSTSCQSDTAIVDFPFQSVAGLRRAGLVP